MISDFERRCKSVRCGLLRMFSGRAINEGEGRARVAAAGGGNENEDGFRVSQRRDSLVTDGAFIERRGCSDVDAATWMQRRGWSDVDGATWMERRGCSDVVARPKPPASHSPAPVLPSVGAKAGANSRIGDCGDGCRPMGIMKIQVGHWVVPGACRGVVTLSGHGWRWWAPRSQQTGLCARAHAMEGGGRGILPKVASEWGRV